MRANADQSIIRRDLERVIDQIQDQYKRLEGVDLSWQDACKVAVDIIKEAEK